MLIPRRPSRHINPHLDPTQVSVKLENPAIQAQDCHVDGLQFGRRMEKEYEPLTRTAIKILFYCII